jgi:hypothetical protein
LSGILSKSFGGGQYLRHSFFAFYLQMGEAIKIMNVKRHKEGTHILEEYLQANNFETLTFNGDEIANLQSKQKNSISAK